MNVYDCNCQHCKTWRKAWMAAVGGQTAHIEGNNAALEEIAQELSPDVMELVKAMSESVPAEIDRVNEAIAGIASEFRDEGNYD